MAAGGTRASGEGQQEQRRRAEKEMTYISTQSFLRSQRLFSLTSPEENSMLKISFSETPPEERWIRHVWLTDPCVHDLKTCWRKNHRTHLARTCVLDLN